MRGRQVKRTAKKKAAKKVRFAKSAAKPVEMTAPMPPEAPKKTDVKITAAKGRPMLTWVGKRPLSYVTAFVAGRYELPAPNGAATVAVKIIDMLGEDVLVTQTV